MTYIAHYNTRLKTITRNLKSIPSTCHYIKLILTAVFRDSVGGFRRRQDQEMSVRQYNVYRSSNIILAITYLMKCNVISHTVIVLDIDGN